jgi:iron complex transport system permease protein
MAANFSLASSDPRPKDPASPPPVKSPPSPRLKASGVRFNPVILAILLTLVLFGLAYWSLISGYVHFSPAEVATILWAKLGWGTFFGEPERTVIIWEVRVPRIAVAMATGAALALSGGIFQGLLRNPLADPYTLGVSSGAALGAATVIFLETTTALGFSLGPWAPTLGAFAGAFATLIAVLALAKDRDGSLPPTNLILAGVIVAAILSAALSFLKYLAGDQVSSIVFWLLGSFVSSSFDQALVVFSFLIPALGVALFLAMDLNVMTLGLSQAATLGVDAKTARVWLLVVASLVAAAAVAVSGIIGFVGLITPHLVRALTGPDHRTLLPLSALAGAVALVGADLLVRVLLPGEIPVGVLTALIAGPVFLIIFRRRIRGLGHD